MSIMEANAQVISDYRTLIDRYYVNMVAEPVKERSTDGEQEVIDLEDDDDLNCLGEINMVGAADMPPGLSATPDEVERRIKQEISNKVAEAVISLRAEFTDGLQQMAAITVNPLRGEVQAAVQQINTDGVGLNLKVDQIKAAQDANDGNVKSEVASHFSVVNAQLLELKGHSDQMWNQLQGSEAQFKALADAVNLLHSASITGDTTAGGGDGGGRPHSFKGLMDSKVISNLEKLTNEVGDFSIWMLRLKNALDQANPSYRKVLELIEKIPDVIVTFEHWESVGYDAGLAGRTDLTEVAYRKLSRDLYVLLVDKCTNNQVMSFANDNQDGFYAFNNLYRSFTQTAG